MHKQTWCGNFNLITNDETLLDRLQIMSNLLMENNSEIYKYNLDEEIIIFNEKNEEMRTNIHTFLFFHDYFHYWKLFHKMNKLTVNVIFEDLFSRNCYLEFDKVPEDKEEFFNELLSFFNDNMFKENLINKYNNYFKNIFLSFPFAEIFKNAKKKIIIPKEYEDIIIENIFNEKIIQYKNQTFKKIFNEISLEKKLELFTQKEIMKYISPFLLLGYSYEYKNGEILYKNKSQIALVKNDFETFFIKYNNLFKKIKNKEQKQLLHIFIYHNRKNLALDIIENFSLSKSDYNDEEFSLLKNKINKSTININIDNYFLNKKLINSLGTKDKIKKPKI